MAMALAPAIAISIRKRKYQQPAAWRNDEIMAWRLSASINGWRGGCCGSWRISAMKENGGESGDQRLAKNNVNWRISVAAALRRVSAAAA